MVTLDTIAVEAADGLAGAEDGAAEAVTFPEVAAEEFVGQVFGVIHFHLQLFEDDALFLFDVLIVEARVANEVRDDIEGFRDVFVEDLDVEADDFFGGEGVEASADGVHFAGDGFGGTFLSALEDHVFDEV